MREETIVLLWAIASASFGLLGVAFVALQRSPAEQKASILWRLAAYLLFFVGFSALGCIASSIPFFILHLVFKS